MTGIVVWFSGLPSAGKSTLAAAVAARLRAARIAVCLLDGDEVRQALVPPPGYSDEERENYYQTLGNLAALLARQGLCVLVAATAHLRRHREHARRAAPDFLEIYVSTPLAECERRDAKGIYARARRGEIQNVPGVDAPFEAPEKPGVTAGSGLTGSAAEAVVAAIQARQSTS